MRILPVALALSAAIHGAALAWALTRKPPPPLVNLRVAPRVEVVPVEIEPMAVALLDDPTVVPARPSPSREVSAPQPRIAATTVHAGGEIGDRHTPSGPAGTEPTHSALMTMREPEPPELKGLSAAFIGHFLAKPVVAQPNPIEGEHVQDDIESTEHDLHDSYWIAHSTPDQVSAARQKLVALYDARDGRELKHDGAGYKTERERFVAHFDPDGTAHFKDKPNWQWKSVFFAKFDVTEALMREHGDDPYASEKRELLDETRDERYEIGKRYEHEQLGRSAVLAKETLDWLWAKTRDPRERKEALFELWDDCAEAGNADLVEGGRAARGVIVGFIRAHLSGAAAFTPDELAALNAHKHSTATFAPYTE